ncbi:MAG: CidA/LrgA family protein [[Clostridium] fimetarium]|nr:CidA/LrgA family protein [Alistipes timonensis]MCM1406707.1 CidA/LrgA family protein [[Clostridium] fimetarium]
MILQCAVIFAFLAFGELVVYLTGIPVPSSIIGMISLAAALKLKFVRLMWVDKVADFLVRNLGFFFVPAGVGVMRCFDVISREWGAIVTATVVSTFAIIAVTGWTHQLCRRALAKHTKGHGTLPAK